MCFFFSSRRRHTRSLRDWSSDVCSSDLRSQGFQNEVAFHLDNRAFGNLLQRTCLFARSCPGHRSGVLSFRQRSEEHTSELQSRRELVCRLLLEKKKVQNGRSVNAYPFEI